MKDRRIFYDQSVSVETNKRGLLIREAYFGLAEHIYHIEAGLAPGESGGAYEIPKSVLAYY